MSISFKGKRIAGSHGDLVKTSPEQHVRRVKYWDLAGEAEVVGGSGGRNISVEITLHNKYSQSKLVKELKRLDNLVGSNGALGEGGNVNQSFEACTFDGYEPIPLPGQASASMLQDVAGTLRDDNGTREADDNGQGYWFITVILRFRQLKA